MAIIMAPSAASLQETLGPRRIRTPKRLGQVSSSFRGLDISTTTGTCPRITQVQQACDEESDDEDDVIFVI